MTKAGGRTLLADISPTLLDLMGLPKPVEMTGEVLLRPHVTHRGSPWIQQARP